MTARRGAYSSSYMHWAKTQSQSRFNLATSGLGNLSIRDLRVSLDDLELTHGGYGYQPLLQMLGTRYGVHPSSIVTAAGTSFANHLAMAALFEPGEEILFEEPAYDPMLATALYLGADVKRFQRKFEDGFRVSPEEIQAKVSERTRLILITNIHNPSGVLTDDDTMKHVGQIARRTLASPVLAGGVPLRTELVEIGLCVATLAMCGKGLRTFGQVSLWRRELR